MCQSNCRVWIVLRPSKQHKENNENIFGAPKINVEMGMLVTGLLKLNASIDT